MKEKISISFSVSDNYSQHLAVVITSILVNNVDSQFVFHILHRNISNENKQRVGELSKMYSNCEIKFYLVDHTIFEKLPIPLGAEHITHETYYRYILPDILIDENRTLYLDVDIICEGDLRPLWNIDLGDNIVAAVSEGIAGEDKKRKIGLVGEVPYFNAGVLVLDLRRMRNERSSMTLISNTKKYSNCIAWPDQDIINITFRGRILALDFIWNAFNRLSRVLVKQAVLRHFANATQKPWCNIWKNTTWPIYLKYLLKSSYRSNACGFIWGHIKGFFFFKYTKKGVTRYLFCGFRVCRRRSRDE